MGSRDVRKYFNQCETNLPTIFSLLQVTVIANDDILYSRTVQDCERFCDDVRNYSNQNYLFVKTRNYSRLELSTAAALLRKVIVVTSAETTVSLYQTLFNLKNPEQPTERKCAREVRIMFNETGSKTFCSKVHVMVESSHLRRRQLIFSGQDERLL